MKCGYPLARLTERRCPECGTPFEYESFVPKGDFPVLIVDGKKALLTPDVMDALRRAKIPFMELGGQTMELYGFHSVSQSKSHVGVPRSQYFDAVTTLRQLCDDLFEAPPQDLTVDWTCSECGEVNPGPFEICWKCETPRPDDAPKAL